VEWAKDRGFRFQFLWQADPDDSYDLVTQHLPAIYLFATNRIHPACVGLSAGRGLRGETTVASTKTASETVLQGVLVNYLVAQARTVESSVNRALWALLERNERVASEVFLTEPRINEMEILIDEHAIRMLRQPNLLDPDVRLIVATLKINNDLERMGDLAVNLSERAISLAGMGEIHTPAELEPMTTAVRAMVSKCLGALIYQNVDLASQVLESDDVVDQYRDQVFEKLLAGMTEDPSLAAPNLHYVLASRHLERIADHATNIAEDILFWVRGLEVRHGRAKQMEAVTAKAEAAGAL
jgi:phosphate transport system protein